MNFHELNRFQRKVDRFFGNYNTFYPEWENNPVDLFENDEAYKVIIDLPGINKDNVKIESDVQTLQVSLENKEEDIETQPNYYLKERRNEDFSRSFKFSTFIDPSKSNISYINGTLTIILPKAEGSKKVSLEID